MAVTLSVFRGFSFGTHIQACCHAALGLGAISLKPSPNPRHINVDSPLMRFKTNSRAGRYSAAWRSYLPSSRAEPWTWCASLKPYTETLHPQRHKPHAISTKPSILVYVFAITKTFEHLFLPLDRCQGSTGSSCRDCCENSTGVGTDIRVSGCACRLGDMYIPVISSKNVSHSPRAFQKEVQLELHGLPNIMIMPRQAHSIGWCMHARSFWRCVDTTAMMQCKP